MSYDKNGNLLTLNRSYGGSVSNTLTYSYAGTGNRLNQVEDGAGNTDPTKGFVNGGSSSANEMSYDAAGNLTQDLNRGILAGGIVYNVLNLPRQVTKAGQQVKYDYDAAGSKRQTTAPGGDQTLYEGAFEYGATGVLARINLEEGQLLRDVSGVYTVQYFLKDHLGNVRSVVKEDGSVVQRSDYYAFGLPMLKTGTTAVNKYLTGGKEVQPQTNWLDFGARMYDPTIGKWLTIDPLAETSRRWSPYTYVYNNPLRFIDPDGMEGAEYSNGYSTSSVRDETGSVSHDGVFQNSGGGSGNNGQGTGTAANGSGPGKGKKAEDNSSVSSTRLSKALPMAAISSEADGPLPFGEILGASIILGAVVSEFLYGPIEHSFSTDNVLNP